MVTKTSRTDFKLKSCQVGPSGELICDDGEILDLVDTLKKVFGIGCFDLSANTVKKDEVDIGDLDDDE